MPIEDFGPNLTFLSVIFGVKAFFVLFLIFYAIFALILYRQAQIMDKALPTPIAGVLTFIAILQIGIALGLLFIVIGAF